LKWPKERIECGSKKRFVVRGRIFSVRYLKRELQEFESVGSSRKVRIG